MTGKQYKIFGGMMNAKHILLGAGLFLLGPVGCSAAQADNLEVGVQEKQKVAASYDKDAVIQVTVKAVPQTVMVTGTVEPQDRADLVPDISGKVLELMVERGDRVEKGDPLLRLDTRMALLAQQEAQANLAAMRSQKKLADDTCKRSQALYQKGAITKAEWERDQNNCTQATQSLRAATVRLEQATQSLQDGVTKAPFSGIISKRWISLGEFASPQGKLFTLVDDSVLRADLSLSESVAPYARLGDKVRIEAAGSEELSFEGEITRIGVEVDPVTRGLLVEVTLPDTAKEKLRPGMFVKGFLVTGEVELPVVPKEALIQRGKTWRIFLVKDQQLEERVVHLGPDTANGDATILDGLSPGDRFAGEAKIAKDGAELQ